jgi:dihydrofolate reductase
MRNLISWDMISLDGYFEGPEKGGIEWFRFDEQLERYILDTQLDADTLLFGRVTYEGMAAHWSTAQGAIADHMNRLPKLVGSRTLETAAWNNTTVVKDDLGMEVARLKQQGSGNMFVFGSANLSKTLISEGLFDEYRIGLAPVIHGRGKPLVSDGHDPQRLRLLEARTLSTGCVILRYLADTGA